MTRGKGGQAPPSKTPPLVRDVWCAYGAALRVSPQAVRAREDGLTHAAEPTLTATQAICLSRRVRE